MGDKVRISRYKEKYFAKDIPHRNHNLNWTEEVFTVDYKIQYTNPITYKLKDLNNEEIESSFYEPELLKAKQDIIGKIRRKTSLGEMERYGDDYNSWIPIKDLKII